MRLCMYVCVYVCGLNQIQIFSNKIIKNIQKNKKKKIMGHSLANKYKTRSHKYLEIVSFVVVVVEFLTFFAK